MKEAKIAGDIQQKCRTNLRAAFDNIYDQHPYLSNTVSSWNLMFSEEVGTAGTNGGDLVINPKFLASLNLQESAFLILHEAGHIFCGHHLRMENRDKKLWNAACDLALNCYLKQYIPINRPTIQNSFLMPGQEPFQYFEGAQNAEFYYEKLIDQQESNEDKVSNNDAGDGDSGQAGGDSVSSKSPDAGNVKPQSQEPEQSAGGHSEPANSQGQVGSKPADGSNREVPQNLLGSFSSPLEGSESEEELEDIRQEWQERRLGDARAAQNSNPGSVPDWATEEAGIGLQSASKADWRALLRRFVQRTAHTRWSYERPHRRTAYRTDIIMPARHSRTPVNGVMVVDTSGSMKPHDCERALNELQRIFEAYPDASITLLQCDTRLIEEGTVTLTRRDFPLRVPPKWWGRGGTNLGPAMDYVREHKSKKDWGFVLVLTDMEWNVVGCPDPTLPTMWLATNQSYKTNASYQPKFGKVVEINV